MAATRFLLHSKLSFIFAFCTASDRLLPQPEPKGNITDRLKAEIVNIAYFLTIIRMSIFDLIGTLEKRALKRYQEFQSYDYILVAVI